MYLHHYTVFYTISIHRYTSLKIQHSLPHVRKHHKSIHFNCCRQGPSPGCWRVSRQSRWQYLRQRWRISSYWAHSSYSLHKWYLTKLLLLINPGTGKQMELFSVVGLAAPPCNPLVIPFEPRSPGKRKNLSPGEHLGNSCPKKSSDFPRDF